jgi:hypothetical protein
MNVSAFARSSRPAVIGHLSASMGRQRVLVTEQLAEVVRLESNGL